MATESAEPALRTRDLRKSFRTKRQAVEAVRGIDLDVRPGEIFGFLGPNGAGKTTTLRMLATLLPIGGGEATVAGVDVRRKPHEVRRRIGYVGQLGGADLPATGRENLLLQGRLYGAGRADVARRAAELIDLLELSDFADRVARTYSGGQRRRLDVALGIMHRPAVLFLDEPTTGLDPQNRANLWDQLRALRALGTTIFLTTHYLEEADVLSDRLAIIDHGRIVSEGTPRELKQRVAGDTVLITPRQGTRAIDELCRDLVREPSVEGAELAGGAVRVSIADSSQAMPAILGLLQRTAVPVESVALWQPSLDDVFLRQTGRSLRDAGDGIDGEEVA
ncbi:MAG: ATP-binding cassette domain-containing protein [Candidatus Dormibacteraeota bacterium]|nr:ATP-binding cassette domain-containing protein [Candidatus Dormibacteraeota bacterium]MBO0760871.1 ATP-binding cassette domain-containing protein [Candidatus Dormibacteraeota bacterium]